MADITKKIEAIRGSIQHWRDNEEALDPNHVDCTGEKCPLCALYNGNIHYPCVGCPISNYTRQNTCEDTPYEDAWFAWRDWLTQMDKHDIHPWIREWTYRETFKARARDELVFLEEILRLNMN